MLPECLRGKSHCSWRGKWRQQKRQTACMRCWASKRWSGPGQFAAEVVVSQENRVVKQTGGNTAPRTTQQHRPIFETW